jgi:chromate transporter
MKTIWELFLIFFKIGTFTIGGGYAMVPLIEKEVVDKKEWIEREDFVQMLALAQSAPGPIAVDVAVFVGYKIAGIPGVIASVFGTIFTAFAVLLVIAIYYTGASGNVYVERAFKGIRPAVVALVAAPVIRMGKNAKINKKTIFIPIVTVILVAFLNINPIFIIIISAVGGFLYGYASKKRRLAKNEYLS